MRPILKILSVMPGLLIMFPMIHLLTISNAWSDTDHLKGLAFSDPSVTQEMPDEWRKQPIKYIPENVDMDLVVDINQQLYPHLKPLIEEYAKKKGLKVAYSEATCGKSAGLIERKQVDIGGFCCPPASMDRLPGLRYHTLGIIPLSIFAHPSNKVDNVTIDQLRGIFQGDIYKWSEVGGANKPVRVVASMHCKMRPGHWRLLLKDADLFSPRMTEEGDMSDTIALVAATPDAIGYEAGLVAKRFRHRGEVKTLKIDGYSSMNIEDTLKGDYALYRTYNITTWEGEGLENRHVPDLVKYIFKNLDKIYKEMNLIPAELLRKNGWKFNGSELIGEPVR